MNTLLNEIKRLLSMGREGTYWDYKENYANTPEDKLLDIICMANNLENRDAYLIPRELKKTQIENGRKQLRAERSIREPQI